MAAKIERDQVIVVTISAVFLVLTYLPLLASERTVDLFAREDGIFENLTAAYLLATAGIFAAGIFRYKKSPWLLRQSYLGLALLFFIGAGEEISWGERIFHWDDHNLIRGINVQRELTLHNLKFFQGEDSILPVSISQLFILFMFAFCVIIPLAARYLPKLERLLSPIFPVMPWLFGFLVIWTYVLQKATLRFLPLLPDLYQHSSMPLAQGVHELREHGYTLALMLSSVFYFALKKRVMLKDPVSPAVPDTTGLGRQSGA